MSIMYHVHYSSTEIEGGPMEVPKSTPENTNQASVVIYLQMSIITVKNLQFLSCGQNVDLHNIFEIENEEVCHLVAERVT